MEPFINSCSLALLELLVRVRMHFVLLKPLKAAITRYDHDFVAVFLREPTTSEATALLLTDAFL